jgi:hypothetical protein
MMKNDLKLYECKCETESDFKFGSSFMVEAYFYVLAKSMNKAISKLNKMKKVEKVLSVRLLDEEPIIVKN